MQTFAECQIAADNTEFDDTADRCPCGAIVDNGGLCDDCNPYTVALSDSIAERIAS